MNLKNYVTILLTFFCFFTQGQNNKTEIIDTFIQECLEEFKEIPGLAITIVQGDNPIFTKAYGYSDVENKKLATTNSSYYIASVTKSYVGVLAAVLEDEGILDLNKPITEYAPIKYFEDKSVFEGITIKELLSHTSGIQNRFLTFQFASLGEYTRTSLNELLEKQTRSLNNNKVYSYDNLGYNILDIILYEEFNLNWKDLLEHKIFRPLQMNHTSAYRSVGEVNNWDLPKPYTSINDKRLPSLANTIKNDATFQAAGGMNVSIEDAQKWLIMNMNKGMFKGSQLFSKNVIEKTHKKITETNGINGIFTDVGYSLGFKEALFSDEKVIYHFGGFDGYFALQSFLPEHNIGVTVFCNESHFGDNVSNLIAAFAYDLLLGKITSIEDYKTQKVEVYNRINSIQESFAKDRASRAERPWGLTLKNEAYVGTYKNQILGTITIDYIENMFKVKMGNTEIVATPSSRGNAMRVEFKDTRGEDIIFKTEGEKVTELIFGGGISFFKQ